MGVCVARRGWACGGAKLNSKDCCLLALETARTCRGDCRYWPDFGYFFILDWLQCYLFCKTLRQTVQDRHLSHKY